ncbi:MAG: hypothetical protein H6668_16365 [Ardenticatenaceae bacterium]|nr:hypothetical protein [Ardenticatenaceae bacterium]
MAIRFAGGRWHETLAGINGRCRRPPHRPPRSGYVNRPAAGGLAIAGLIGGMIGLMEIGDVGVSECGDVGRGKSCFIVA